MASSTSTGQSLTPRVSVRSSKTLPIDRSRSTLTDLKLTTTNGTTAQREIALLATAFAPKFDAWAVKSYYDSHARNNTGPPPLAATWTDLAGVPGTSALFEQTAINTSTNSPHSNTAHEGAVVIFNDSVKRLIIKEIVSSNTNAQAVLAALNARADKATARTVFLSKAFDVKQFEAATVYAQRLTDYFETWAELETRRGSAPVFRLDEGLTHVASPFVTDDWAINANTTALGNWGMQNGRGGR